MISTANNLVNDGRTRSMSKADGCECVSVVSWTLSVRNRFQSGSVDGRVSDLLSIERHLLLHHLKQRCLLNCYILTSDAAIVYLPQRNYCIPFAAYLLFQTVQA